MVLRAPWHAGLLRAALSLPLRGAAAQQTSAPLVVQEGGDASAWGACTEASGCCAVVLEVEVLTGQGHFSGTRSGVAVAFKIKDQWTEDMVILKEILDPTKVPDDEDEVATQFRMSAWPTQLRISAMGKDAFGYQRIGLSLPGGETVQVVNLPSESIASATYPESESSIGYDYWIDSDEDAPSSHTFDVPQDVNTECFERLNTAKKKEGERCGLWGSTGTDEGDCEEGLVCAAPEQPVPGASSTCVRAVETSFDCQAGFINWQDGWSKSKKEWCCAHEEKGCVAGEGEFDCDEGLDRWEKGWSDAKKKWCCESTGHGCREPFDCDEGFINWQDGWSKPKKEWCCAHEAKGCVTGEGEFDCDAGLDRWETGWSDAKKKSCCESTGHGCPASVDPSEPFDCDAGYDRWESGWSEDKKEWCCANKDRACPTSSQPRPLQKHDCSVGDPDGVPDWSPEKRLWCCGWETSGCEGGKRYDCSIDLDDSISRWSPDKARWCCDNEGKGCPSTEQAPFDCGSQLATWDESWGEEQKDWCCARAQLGCPGAGKFDCSLGSDAQDAWSEEKQAWCSETTCGQAELHPVQSGIWQLTRRLDNRRPPTAAHRQASRFTGVFCALAGVLLLLCSCCVIIYMSRMGCGQSEGRNEPRPAESG